MATADERIASLEEKVEALEKRPRENHLVILGETLKIPLGPWFIAALVTVLAATIFFVWFAPADRVSTIVGLFHLDDKGKAVQAEEISSVYTLVTPHQQTLSDLQAQGVNLTDEEKKYYALDPGALEAFGKQIKDEGAQGYARREVWGEGSRPLKRGWEWTINWRKEREIKLGRLLEIYEKHFHRSKGIYIEERRTGKTVFDKEQPAR